MRNIILTSDELQEICSTQRTKTPNIMYAGIECKYDTSTEIAEDAQFFLNYARRDGLKACAIHTMRNDLQIHHIYREVI